MTELGLPEKMLAITRVLTDAGFAHAFGGAIALGYYAEPRATVDIDVNVFVPTDASAHVMVALTAVGVADPARVARDGQVRVWWGRTPIDMFYANDPFHEAMARAVRRVAFRSSVIPILGPEHLVVCKAVFDRRKDWLDVEQVLVCVPGFDAGEVRVWLERIVGGADPRFGRFDDLARAFLGR